MYQTLKTDDIYIKQNLLFIISYYFYICFTEKSDQVVNRSLLHSNRASCHLKTPEEVTLAKPVFIQYPLPDSMTTHAGGREPVVQGGTVWGRYREILRGSDPARER